MVLLRLWGPLGNALDLKWLRAISKSPHSGRLKCFSKFPLNVVVTPAIPGVTGGCSRTGTSSRPA